MWLLSGRRPLGAWLAAVLTFAAFAVVSGYLGIIGQASCGCFGAIQASPWVAFSVDVVALVLLGIARPDFKALSAQNRGAWRRAILADVGLVAVGLAFCAGLIGLASAAYGSPDAALARLRGESVSVLPGIADVGHGDPGETLETMIEVVNRTDKPVRITGGTSDCSCIATQDLPLTLAPGEARQLAVKVRLPGTAGFFNRKAWLWTDCKEAPTVLFGLSGKIDASAE